MIPVAAPALVNHGALFARVIVAPLLQAQRPELKQQHGKTEDSQPFETARKTVTVTKTMDIHADSSRPNLFLGRFSAPLIGNGSPRFIVYMATSHRLVSK
jgi:hypothetical protein